MISFEFEKLGWHICVGHVDVGETARMLSCKTMLGEPEKS